MLGVVQKGEIVGKSVVDDELMRHELKRVVKVEGKGTLKQSVKCSWVPVFSWQRLMPQKAAVFQMST